ncbi:MAG: MarR family transcriptional regulator [Prevotellaceae bacterium]|jgi:DNA-binding MarR family transcriptional regulator|nr:MarR family transcriptional regulator [Prevotellaceae bacterium]
MNTLCKIRDIYRSIADFELRFEKKYNLCLNEGMLLCSLSEVKQLSSGEIAELLGLTPSNASKVIKSAENKGLIKRTLGDKDKRQMYFSLTGEGKRQLALINCKGIGIPTSIKTLLDMS